MVPNIACLRDRKSGNGWRGVCDISDTAEVQVEIFKLPRPAAGKVKLDATTNRPPTYIEIGAWQACIDCQLISNFRPSSAAGDVD